MNEAITATVRSWVITDRPNGLPVGCTVLVGTISGDNKSRFEDGTIIRTSKIVKYDKENNLVYTLNSVYKLEGEPRGKAA